MKPLKLACLVALLALAAPVVMAQMVYVDDCTPPSSGSGTLGDPYCAIQTAVLGANDGDEIRVFPGTYNECVDTFQTTIGTRKSLSIVADDWVTSGDNTTTIIDGTGQCFFPFSTVNITGEGSPATAGLQGFTVTGGIASGIFGVGSVNITNNLVDGNLSNLGGGIYTYSATCYYGPTVATVNDNIVTNNDAQTDGMGADGDGGGVYIFAVGTTTEVDCTGGDADVTVDNNVIDGNTAASAFGGGMIVFTNTSPNTAVTVQVTQNLIANNGAAVGAISGYGGGAWLTTFGFGSELIDFTNNTVAYNNSAGDGGGISAWVDICGNAGDLDCPNAVTDHTILLDDNTVTGNSTAGNGGGIDMFILADRLTVNQSLDYRVTNNTVTGNASSGNLLGLDVGGGGVLTTFFSERSSAASMNVEVTGNTVTQNNAAIGGGGMTLWVRADSDPLLDGATLMATAEIVVQNNLTADNIATGASSAVGGGILVYNEAYGDATATTRIVRNTINDNFADLGAGGIEIESYTDNDSLGLGTHLVELQIASNIIANNDGFGVGGPFPGTGSGVLQIPGGDVEFTRSFDYNWFDLNTVTEYESWINPGPDDTFNVDPMLASTTRVPLRCSPTIDAGDPADAFDQEPLPNGMRVNAGHTGGTANATRSLADSNGDQASDGLDILALSVAFGAMSGEPRYNGLTDFDGNNVVDGVDLALLAADFGDRCPINWGP